MLPTKRQLFDVAVARAIKEGLIADESEADAWESQAEYHYFKLNGKYHKPIAKYANTELIKDVDAKKEAGLIELSPEEAREKAAEWAKAAGYTIPTKFNGCLSVALVIIGSLMYVIPGIIVFIWLWWQNKNYESEMNKIVGRWNDAGRPKPGVKQAPPLNLEAVNDNESSATLETKLNEAVALKEKGLISDDECQQMRAKILGL
jgi:hypothetical protein